MKKWLNPVVFLLMVSGTLVFTSCNDNENEGSPQPTSLIVGTWQYEALDLSITVDGQGLVAYLAEAFELSAEEADDLAEDFKAAMNNFDGMSWSFTNDGSYTVTSTDGNESGTWALSADSKKLTLSSDGESEEINVASLTAGKLQLSYSEVFEEDMDEDGIDEELAISISLGLKK